MRPRRPAYIAASLGLMSLAACSSRGASSFIAFGAYFPGWMACGAIGLLTAIAARMALVLTGLAESVPFQLGVCVSAGLIAASIVWLMWFGR